MPPDTLSIGLEAGDIQELTVLSALPFGKRFGTPIPGLLQCRKKIVRYHSSSGTTGKPIVVVTRHDIAAWAD